MPRQAKAKDDHENIGTHINRYMRDFRRYNRLDVHDCDAEEGFREYAAYIFKRILQEGFKK